MQIDGQCHCGQVTYQAEIDPDRLTICHCTDCQQLTGSPFRVSIGTAKENIRVSGLAPQSYTKTGSTGSKRFQYFCPECSSPLFTTGEGEDAAVWGIRWGSIRQRAELVPKRQVWCRSAAPWIGHIGDLPWKLTE